MTIGNQRIAYFIMIFSCFAVTADPINYYASQREKKYIIDAIKFRPSGYIKSEIYGDTRQNVEIAGAQYIIIPEPQELDPNGQDINAHPDVGLSAVETRLRFDMDLSDVFYHNIQAAIEGDFWGHFDDTAFSQPFENTIDAFNFQRFRLRHAYAQLAWPHSLFIGGQYWHPIFVPECFPDIVSFNEGSPIDPYSRTPQFRYMGLFNDWRIIMAMLIQSTNTSAGPLGNTSVYIRNGAMPEFHIQMQRLWSEHIAGVGVDVKRISPRIESNGYKVNESLVSAAVIAFTAFNWEKGAIRTKLCWAQNGTDFGLLSGYGVTSVDAVTGEQTYTNTAVFTWWADACYRFKSIEPGFFIGTSRNLGVSKPLHIFPSSDTVLVYAEPYDGIHYASIVVRFSPRIRWKAAPLEIAGELEYTRAVYGTLNQCGKTIDNVPVYNVRLNFSAYYFF